MHHLKEGRYFPMDVAALNDRPTQLECPEHEAIAHLLNRYFESINLQDFATTASLFAPDGVLFPPFDAAMEGREAIANYLEAEAKGLQLFPLTYEVQDSEQNIYACQVWGKVQTSVFTVNVGWKFQVNHNFQIVSTNVNLLASMEELLKLKS